MSYQISARGYERLRPGTRGAFYWPGRKPTPVTFLGMDGVEVLIEGKGVRPRWHQGLHAGLLQSAFSWDIGEPQVSAALGRTVEGGLPCLRAESIPKG